MKYSEFTLISRYFHQSIMSRSEVEIGIGDDCALLHIPEGKKLAISTDTLVCNKHFLPEIDPSDLAYKALAVNLSDLAAMGAEPAWLTLSLTIPKISKVWLNTFSKVLLEQVNYYNMQLIGGDTTAGPLSVTLSVYGFLPIQTALERSGAKPGDGIYVTGTLGDSAAGLAIIKNKLIIKNIHEKKYLVERHLRPTPRVLHGQILREYANSAIDLSDGLITDLKKILKSSNVGAYINLDLLPLSSELKKNVEKDKILDLAISGGEDYELCCTVPECYQNQLKLIFKNINTSFTYIGKIVSKHEGLNFIKNNSPVEIKWKGYEHFS